MKNYILILFFLVPFTMSFGQEVKKVTLEERTEKYLVKMQREIGLTDEQKKKIYDLRLEKIKKIHNLRAKHEAGSEKLNEKAKKIAADYNHSLSTLLNEGQLEKWKVFRAAEKEKFKAASEKRKNNKLGKEPILEDDDYLDQIEE